MDVYQDVISDYISMVRHGWSLLFSCAFKYFLFLKAKTIINNNIYYYFILGLSGMAGMCSAGEVKILPTQLGSIFVIIRCITNNPRILN